jgi:hypothetical protein
MFPKINSTFANLLKFGPVNLASDFLEVKSGKGSAPLKFSVAIPSSFLSTVTLAKSLLRNPVKVHCVPFGAP